MSSNSQLFNKLPHDPISLNISCLQTIMSKTIKHWPGNYISYTLEHATEGLGQGLKQGSRRAFSI